MGDVAVLPTRSDYPIPDKALDSHMGILGKVGTGKSYTARGLAERLLKLGRQVVIIDPTGAWYGLRTGFEVPIFGGRHGDVAIGDLAGDPVASVIVEKQASAIIDLSLMTANGQKRFMRDFAHRLRQKPPGALYLFLDEADEFLPQEKVKGVGAGTDLNLFGDLKWMVRRGRLNGFRVTMITQRPAEIAKAVLTQIETLVAHRLTSPQDRRAIEEWVKGHADPEAHKEVLSTLATLDQGEAWVWAPDLGILKREKMPRIETFDSGRTPEPGEIEVKPPALADLDLTAIEASLAAVVEEAKANDPKAMKAEVARLTRELAAAAQKGAAPAPPTYPDLRDTLANMGREFARQSAALRPQLEAFIASAIEADAYIQKLFDEAIERMQAGGATVPPPPMPRPVPALAPVQRQPQAVKVPQGDGGGPLTGPQRRVLNALAWWRAFGIDQPSSEQVAFVAGYSASSSGYANLKGAMRTAGLIEYPVPGTVSLTAAGAEEAEQPAGEVSRDAFHAAVRAKLSGPQMRLLNPLLETYPEALSSADLATAADYSTSSSGFANLKGNMRTLGFVDYPQPGYVRAADWLFP